MQSEENFHHYSSSHLSTHQQWYHALCLPFFNCVCTLSALSLLLSLPLHPGLISFTLEQQSSNSLSLFSLLASHLLQSKGDIYTVAFLALHHKPPQCSVTSSLDAQPLLCSALGTSPPWPQACTVSGCVHLQRPPPGLIASWIAPWLSLPSSPGCSNVTFSCRGLLHFLLLKIATSSYYIKLLVLPFPCACSILTT